MRKRHPPEAMAEVIRTKAQISVARGCGFGGLAIICLMVGMSANIVNAFEAGGFSMMLMCAILLLKRRYLDSSSHRRTEVWIMLTPEERPDDAIAKPLIREILGRAYLEFALLSAKVAAFLFMLALFFRIGKAL